jgi:hypothetical protein
VSPPASSTDWGRLQSDAEQAGEIAVTGFDDTRWRTVERFAQCGPGRIRGSAAREVGS